jgi:hypothetical protein
MRTRGIVAMVLGFLIPGTGHFFLGRRARGIAFFALVVFMFGLGLAIDGSMFTLRESRGEILLRLASLGSMGSGLLYILGAYFGPPGDITKPMFEYGRTFTLTAGLMNLLLVLDCWDIAVRGKA